MTVEENRVVWREKSFPMIEALFYEFKAYCAGKTWKAYDIGDLVVVGEEYHKFFWIRGLHLSTFKSIVANPSCAFREGRACRTVKAKYLAWVLPAPPPTELWLYLVKGDPTLSRTVALFDLSRVYEGEVVGITLNQTDSVVFHGFEQFLRERYGIRFSSLIGRRPAPDRMIQLMTRLSE